MSWVKLDDTFPEHPKVVTAGGDAAWLHVCALAYCNRHPKLSGLVPREMLGRLSDRKNPNALAARLVTVGLWDDDPSGWRIHDYHEFQPTAEKIEELRRKRAEAGAKGGKTSKPKGSKAEANCLPDASDASEANWNPDPTRPDPSPDGVTISGQTDRLMTAETSVSPSVDEALDLYARHVYERAPGKCKGTPQRYMAGIKRKTADERAGDIEIALAVRPDCTAVDLLYDVFDLNEMDVFRLTGKAKGA